ncbi:MAG: fumarylacetoacetate hydrolase family protein, partial [Alphaproteobacteria bacterium]|nr:fumarylacetoacetate hydrolase family protein [Alphaproteobacteria bacterium]
MIRPSLLAAIVGLCCLAEAAAAEVTRFVRFADGAGAHYGVLEDNRVHQLSGTPFGPHERTGQSHALSAVRLLPPVVPGKVIAVGLNYRSHAGMSGGARPELFAKLPSAVIGPGQAIVIPPDARNVHYEGELVAIIGRRARDIQPADAARYILGVTAGNDVSERSWQASDLQWLRAKA